jgi:acyl-CoA reductase-like NAD-dependent aldehyde dehydrogenase
MTTTTAPALPEVLLPGRLFIDGEWQNAESTETFEVINPALAESCTEVAEGDQADIDRAVKAARAAFESGPWPDMTPRNRGRLLWALARRLEERKKEIALVETLNHQDRGGHDSGIGARSVRLHSPRASRCGGRDRPLELPAQLGIVEGRSSVGGRVYGGSETG